MKRFITTTSLMLALITVFSNPLWAEPIDVLLQTNQGDIRLALDKDKAPITVENFVTYANQGFYDGTIFHRVIQGFMIQGGGYTPEMQKKATRDPIRNEANNGLKNKRGNIAMARTPPPHTATAQFFINLKDNGFLDHKDEANWGYAVFGKVTEGMGVVDRIAEQPTGVKHRMRDVPLSPVIIEKVTVLSEAPAAAEPAPTPTTQ
jgi:cyclophilin family peptidyl-prolyl cis-trans isomerase